MRFRANSRDIRFTNDVGVVSKTSALISRKIWLPKALYDSLPWFYLVSGIVALMATLYINGWYWVVPHYFLFCAACLHLSAIVFFRRRSRRKNSD